MNKLARWGISILAAVVVIASLAWLFRVELMLNTIENPENYLTFFLKIDNVKFRNKVVPGDTLVFSLKLISPIRRGLCHMKGIGYVNDKPVIEAEMLAQISKKQDV